jgi:PAS domain S-box-containing protein
LTQPNHSSTQGIPSTIILNPEEARQEHLKRVYRHHVIEIPALRAFGMIMIAFFVLLHNLYLIPKPTAWPDYWRLMTYYLPYITLSWLALFFFFNKVQKIHLGIFFLLTDIIFFLLAIYYSGGEKSWLFFLLMVRTADQARTSMKNTFIFANASAGGYALLLLYLSYFEHRPVALLPALTATCFIYASNIYLTFIGRATGSLRNRLNAAIRVSRDLIRQLDTKSKSLESSERDYRALVEGSIQGIYILQEQTIRVSNPALARIFGYENQASIIGLNYLTLAAPEERDRLEKQCTALKKGLDPAESFEYKGLRQDGTHVWIECLASAITWQGTPAFLITLQDISMRKEAETALRQANELLEERIRERTTALQQANEALQIEIDERRQMEIERQQSKESYRLLARNIPGVIYKGKADGSVEYLDDRIQQLLDYPIEDFYSRKLRVQTLIHPEDLLPAKRAFLEALKGDNEYIREYRLQRKDGTYLWFQERGQIVCQPDGRIDYISGILFDITERRRMEEEKEKLDGQFRQAQKMEAVARLAGGVAHDFNNMLNVILGFTELALSVSKPIDPIYTDLQAIQEAATRSADLTRQLLAFSRKQTISPLSIDLNDQMQGMKRLLSRIIGEDIQLTFNLSADLWPVFMDPAQVDQIVANLAVNSRDAMPQGGRITLETRNVFLNQVFCLSKPGCVPGEYVMLSFSDTGCGMDQETLDHVFEPFFTTKPEGKGTGLGMATIYGVVNQNNGFVNILSEPNKGTIVQVYIPRHVGQEEPLSVVIAEGRPKGLGETVLLVEDETPMRILAKTMLERLGYIVLEAQGPGEAITQCEKYSGEIDLLLTDVVMPHMNGPELDERIRIMKPGIKTLFMSGYSPHVLPHHGVLEKGSQLLQKPFTLDEFSRKIRKVLDA